MTVFLLWHVAHHNANGEDGGPRHLDGGELYIDEQDGDDVKLLGVYSSRTHAEARIDAARHAPGFADEPDCFMVGEYVVDQDEWAEGFKSVP